MHFLGERGEGLLRVLAQPENLFAQMYFYKIKHRLLTVSFLHLYSIDYRTNKKAELHAFA